MAMVVKDCAAKLRIGVVNSYLEGRAKDCDKNLYPRSHLWGADALAKSGFIVTILESESPDWFSRFAKRLTAWTRGRVGDLAQELEIFRKLSEFDILYIANGNIFWLLLLRRLRLLRVRLVSWTYTPPGSFPFWQFRNLKDCSFLRSGWDGFLCLTKRTTSWYSERTPSTYVKHVNWGTDLHMFTGSVEPGSFFLACGRSNRDYRTLLAASRRVDAPFTLLVSPHYLNGLEIGPNITVAGGPEDSRTDRGISYQDLIQKYYAKALAVVIPRLDLPDDTSGMTNLLEAMAMGRPIIMTRTGCLDMDIEKEGVGFYVKPNDVEGWVTILNYAIANPSAMRERGVRARQLAEQYYNTERFGRDIVTYFKELACAR